jgi:uncharacterized protein (DUF362 family)/Pyruvate/2-oxoacid:ferredoxin oxidoreductase delta subunit
MAAKSLVAIVKCLSYDKKEVYEAVKKGITLLGGIRTLFLFRKRLVLKPNILLGIPPENGATTHPSVFYAVAKILKENGFLLSYGDSPGFGKVESACQKTGIKTEAELLNIPLADFEKGKEIQFENGIQNKIFYLAQGVLEGDGLINIPKLKTHSLTTMTGALKNMFGIIPGLKKAAFHARLHDPKAFARMLVDLNRLITPTLTIMDAVYGMEGNGPSHGDLVHTGLLLISSDPVALDATACRLMGLNPLRVYLLSYAEKIGFGNIQEKSIIIKGIPLKDCGGRKYKLSPSRKWESTIPFLQKLAKRCLIPKPVLNPKVCSKCQICVKICPAKQKALSGKKNSIPKFNYNFCIRCYCCQEMCPTGAIGIKVPLLGIPFYGFSKRS